MGTTTGSDNQVEVLLTADYSNLQEGMASGAESVAAGSAAIRDSIVGQMNDFAALDAIMAKNTKSVADLAAQELALDRLQRDSLISTEELEAATANLATADIALAKAAKAAAVAEEEKTGTMALSAGVTRELAVMTGETLRGNYTRLIGSTTVLATRTGFMGAAIQGLLSPIGLLIAGLAAVTAIEIESHEATRKLEGQLAATGDACGFTVAGVHELEASLRGFGATAGQANDALTAIIKSGKFTGDEFEDVARAAIAMSDMTGESIDKMVQQIARLEVDPVKSIQALNSEFNFLSPAEAMEIRHLIEIGDKAGAAARAIRDLANAEAQRDAGFKESGGIFDKWVDKQKEFWSTIGHGKIFDAEPAKQQLNEATAALNNFIDHYHGAFGADGKGGVKLVDTSGMPALVVSHINDLIAERNTLEQQVTAETKKQSDAQAKNNAAIKTANDLLAGTAGTYKALSEKGMGGVDVEGNLRQQLNDLEVAEKVSYGKRKEFAAEYWAYILQHAKEGTTAYTEAWQQAQSTQKALDEDQLRETDKVDRERTAAARKGAAEAKRAAHEAAKEEMNALAEVRNETEAASQERLAADERIVAAATRLYRVNSTEYRHALDQQRRDTDDYWKNSIETMSRQLEAGTKMEEEQLKSAHDTAVGELQIRRQQNDDDHAQGMISAEQRRSTEKQLDDALFAEDQAYYAKLAALRSGDVKAANKADDEIEKAHLAQIRAKEKADQKYFDELKKKYQQTANSIAHSMTGAFTSIIFHQQTAKQAVIGLAQQMGEQVIEEEVTKPLARWIEGLLIKRTSKAASDAAQSAAEETQRISNAAADAAASLAAVTRASGVAGAQGTASFAGAPWPIDMGAAGFGAAMAATALAFGSVASASRGWGNVPYDDMPTLLHKNEMVLPAPIAKKVRDGAGGGSIHISALDARSFADVVRRNPRGFAAGARRAHRLGHMG